MCLQQSPKRFLLLTRELHEETSRFLSLLLPCLDAHTDDTDVPDCLFPGAIPQHDAGWSWSGKSEMSTETTGSDAVRGPMPGTVRRQPYVASSASRAAVSASSPAASPLPPISSWRVCFVKQIFRKSSSNSFGSQHERSSDFTKGCGTYPSFLFPSMSESVTRRLSPLNSTSLPWWTILSTSADASLSSANTVPHFPNSMLVVSTIDWRS